MAVPLGMTLWMAKMVWLALRGWVSSCLTVADDLAAALRTGDISPFHTTRKDRLCLDECLLQFSEQSLSFMRSPDMNDVGVLRLWDVTGVSIMGSKPLIVQR